uniref:ATP synthase complex subunit 8 n=1 Tax=Olethrius laevipennis TaxID=2547836 RepID=A0A6H0N3S4_9CUCU|nr:ATP synthase F0 subunit 8 [Olethrius laevipennis]
MPQMAPLNWLILTILFSIVFLVFNVLNYFVFNYKTEYSLTKKSSIPINWKW